MARPKEFDEDKALDSAVDCFWEHGYEATSVRDLVRAMGICSASFYNAYGDKRGLFAVALERYANRSMRERVARIEARHPPKRRVAAFLDEIVEKSAQDSDCKGCMLVNSALDIGPHDPEIGTLVSGYLSEIRAFFKRSLAAARGSGDLSRRLDLDATADHFLGVLVGIRVLARTKLRRSTDRRRMLMAVAQPALGILKNRRPG
jgi:TetR/AcrR family transcriptional regulator, transcriptional repressor for nem operon